MTGAEHYQHAERALEYALDSEMGSEAQRVNLAVGQLHATLAIAAPAVLTPDQRELLARALTDAIDNRSDDEACEECTAAPDGLCGGHAADLEMAGRYRLLAAELGIGL